MRTLLDAFSGFDRFYIGSDQLLKNLEQFSNTATKAITNYPPYNIRKLDDTHYVIEMAVAGFGKQDIELTLEENKLKIKGQTTLDTLVADGVDQKFLHKGISDRPFERTFTLADNVVVNNAQMVNGMLKIWLEHIIPENKKSKKINIDEVSDVDTKTKNIDKK